MKNLFKKATLYIKRAEAMTAFIPNYLFKDVGITNSTEGQKVSPYEAKGKCDYCLAQQR